MTPPHGPAGALEMYGAQAKFNLTLGSEIPKTLRAQRQRGRDATRPPKGSVLGDVRRARPTDHPFSLPTRPRPRGSRRGTESAERKQSRDSGPGLGEAPAWIRPPLTYSPARRDSWPWRL